MSWLEEHITEFNNYSSREQAIVRSAPKFFGEIWNELLKIKQEAVSKQFLHTGGQEAQTANIRSIDGIRQRDYDRRVLTISFDGGRTISAMTADGDLHFYVDATREAVPFIKYEDKEISPMEAAETIMGRFLFPEITKH